jgi:hypothetical protein
LMALAVLPEGTPTCRTRECLLEQTISSAWRFRLLRKPALARPGDRLEALRGGREFPPSSQALSRAALDPISLSL